MNATTIKHYFCRKQTAKIASNGNVMYVCELEFGICGIHYYVHMHVYTHR